MNKNLKVRLYPTLKQAQMLEDHFNGYRYAYNLSLEYKSSLWKYYKKSVSGYDMQKELFQIRKETPFLLKCKAECIRDAALNVDKSYKEFFKGKGFPKYKSKRNKQSFSAYQSINIEDNKIIFYRNKIKFKTSISYLEKLQSNKIKQVTFKRDLTGNYWASLLIDEKVDLTLPKIETAVGIDLGLKELVITSDGEYFENNKYLKNEYYRMRRLQRKFSKTKKGGKNREKLRVKIAKKHIKILNQKEHYYHQITNKLIRENQTICIESLKVKNMLKNPKLARSISDASWGIFLKMLEYKSYWYGRELIKINTYFPSSKTCSNCGNIKEKLTLSERKYSCDNCGFEEDRDLNASLNILVEGLRIQGKERPKRLGRTSGCASNEQVSKHLILT